MASAARKSPSAFAKKKGNLMKSRVAVMMVLALGIFMSGTGATLAVSGLAGSGSASEAQYPDERPEGENNTLGVDREGGNGSGGQEPAGAVAGETQSFRQVASTGSSGSLPFTGFLAIPVLIVGLGLLGAGVAMRIRNGSDSDTA
jgi:hypothetical protein